MSGLFGGGHSQSTTPQRYNGIQISSSTAGGCIPLLYGRQRLPFNLIWYGAFKSTANKTSSGGKGGGGQQTSSYTYQSSFAAGICEGPISQIVTTWNDKDVTTLAKLGFTLFAGAGGQTAWSYLTTNFPSQALGYDHICYVGAQNYILGDSASVPNITFEVDGFLGHAGIALTLTGPLAIGATSATLNTPFTHTTGQWDVTFSDGEERVGNFINGVAAFNWTTGGGLINAVTSAILVGGAFDSDPSLFLPDYLTDPNHGAGFIGTIATLTGVNSYQSYILSLGLLLSPCESTQRSASDFVKEIMQITNSDTVVSYNLLKILPYCDAPVAGNGTSFTPNLTPVFIFTDDDFIDAPELTRVATADTFNHVRVEYLDRSNQYNTGVCEATDLGDIALTGERVMSTLNFHEITSSAVAQIVAQLILQVSLYERNTIKFKVRADFCLLEPMDYIGITDAGLGYLNQVFRIKKITDDENDELEIEAMEIPGTVRSSALYAWQGVQGFNANFAADPPNVQAPIFIEANGALVDASGGRELWIGVNGPAANTQWGGCNVFMSFDGLTYANIGQITSPARYGIITSSISQWTAQPPDTGNTLGVQLNNNTQVLETGSASDASENRMLIAVGNGPYEFMSFKTATLTGPGAYNLTTLYRGQYDTNNVAHTAFAEKFVRIDGNLFSILMNPGWMGQTLHFKFCSYNSVGRSTQDISIVTEYTYKPGQSTSVYNTVSESTFATLGTRCVVFSPTSAFKMNDGLAGNWDASVYSIQSYTNGCTAECSPSNFGPMMMGLTLNPTASPSYANIAYAFYMTGSLSAGNLVIYESGVAIGSFGTYKIGDNLQVVYDGKHVSYYFNGALVRSVPIVGQTFFMQSSMFSPGCAIFGMTFSSIATVTTPFTLVPMSGNVAAAGTKVVANFGAVNNWGIRNFQSAESYNNGAQISFSYDGTGFGNNAYIGLSQAPATGGSAAGSNSIASFYMLNFTSQVQPLYNGVALTTIAHLAVPSDVWTITYDNFTFRWWFNGALVAQQYSPNAGPLFLFGDFNTPQLVFQNISFTPYGLATPNVWTTRGGVVVNDDTIVKNQATGAWDSDAYSIIGYPLCHLMAVANQTTGACAIALQTGGPPSVATVAGFGMSYVLHCSNAGNLSVFESGVLISSNVDTYNQNDVLSIVYTGSSIIYKKNATTLHTTLVTTGVNMFADVVVFNNFVAFNNVEFGPTAILPVINTGKIAGNGATSIFAVSTSNVNVGTSGVGATFVIASVTVGPFFVNTSAVVTATGIWTADATHPTAAVNFSIADVLNSLPNNIQVQPIVASQTGVIAAEQTFSLAAGVTQTYYLNGLSQPSGAPLNSYTASATLKVEIVKR